MPNASDFYARFASGEYVVVRDEHKGFVTDQRTIRLAPTRGTLDDLDTAIHEALHAEFPDLREGRVEVAAEHIAAFLWRLGYRWKDKPRRRKR